NMVVYFSADWLAQSHHDSALEEKEGAGKAASSERLASVGEASEAEKACSQRRVRTKFSHEQISRLVKIFDKHKYLDAGERVKTARKLGLTETQVRTWFQNRRMKLKREVQDLAPQVQPLMFQHMHPIQYRAVAGQHSHYPPTGPALIIIVRCFFSL
uniref:Ventral homeobox n=1 Tax=Hippocampus comes TaxID=109280 RepID=A0A3Q2YNA6_HIPCM